MQKLNLFTKTVVNGREPSMRNHRLVIQFQVLDQPPNCAFRWFTTLQCSAWGLNKITSASFLFFMDTNRDRLWRWLLAVCHCNSPSISQWGDWQRSFSNSLGRSMGMAIKYHSFTSEWLIDRASCKSTLPCLVLIDRPDSSLIGSKSDIAWHDHWKIRSEYRLQIVKLERHGFWLLPFFT